MAADLGDAKAIIFDMDGVLFLSNDCHAQAFRETLQSVGITDFAYAELGAGRRTDEVFRQLYQSLDRELPEDELDRLVIDKQTRARAALERLGRVNDYANELVNNLAKKFRLAVASSASRGTIDIFLKKSQNPAAFEFCLDGSLVKEAKPAPEIYLHALEKLGLTPEECVVIEDATNGVIAAVRAGIPVIAITGTEEPEKLRAAGATYVASGLPEVETLLI